MSLLSTVTSHASEMGPKNLMYIDPETPLEPTEEDLEVEPGQVVRLDPGEDVSTPSTPDSGGTYELFQYRTLLQVAAALGIPYVYLTGDTAKGNFSNTWISLIDI